MVTGPPIHVVAMLKRVFLYVSKFLGLFRLSSFLTRKALRILCYHGITLGDEPRFRPMFLTHTTFQQRLALLARKGFSVLPLAVGLKRLRTGSLPFGATVITFDDGFASMSTLAAPLLKTYAFPATVYVTSYYVEKGGPIFRLAAAYMFWRSERKQVDLTGIGNGRLGRIDRCDVRLRREAMEEMIAFAETCLTEYERQELALELGRRLDVDYVKIAHDRLFTLLTGEEIRRLAEDGFDIQLHTHHHRFPVDKAQALREIADNRAALPTHIRGATEHFCYPSGIWSPEHWQWLREAGVESAVTCEAGLNYPDTPRYALRRVLDAENVSAIEFEAEMSGYLDLIRRVRAAATGGLNRIARRAPVEKKAPYGGHDTESVRHPPGMEGRDHSLRMREAAACCHAPLSRQCEKHSKERQVKSTQGAMLVCPITVTEQSTRGIARQGEPVRMGVPLPRGAVRHQSVLGLRAADGAELPVQSRPLDYWPDGSVKWVLLDWLASTGPGREDTFELVTREPQRDAISVDAEASPAVTAREQGGQVTIDTMAARFVIGAGATFPFSSVAAGGDACADPARTRLIVEDGAGAIYGPVIAHVAVEDAGPVRATVCQSGDVVDARGKSLCRMICRASFFAGTATIRFELTLLNPRKAGHPGGCWDLGDEGSVYIKDASLSLAFPPGAGRARARVSPEMESPHEGAEGSVELYQDSSGGENWRSRNHLNRKREVPSTFRGYRLRIGGQERAGLRATPVMCLSAGQWFLGITMPDFWQNFPKAMEASADSLILRLFPGQYADLHELQGGEQKTHVFYVAFGRDRITEEPLEWCRGPLVAHAGPEWYCETGAVPCLAPRKDDVNSGYLPLVDSAIEGTNTFEHKREVIDEYGWRHFGDIYGDHEAVFSKGEPPLVSHYNNQYDGVLGFAIQFMRSGDTRWFRQMAELARHVIDIDLYHTDGDKAAYNRGMFWHTCHYVDADTGTHRAYPSRHTKGGGPNAGHLYTSGLLMHYFLTGDPMSRQAVVDLGEFVLDADDGRKTVFRLLDRGFTGVVTDSDRGYHGPGRAPANAVNALADAYRLTAESRFLDKAEQLIRRCINPQDDFGKLNLLDAERRWFYTMFLQTLGKYLDLKAEIGQRDRMYAYARASLLHYAAWMAQNEYPYLEKPELLEYPTETWAAQDMRKSEVFALAARHASGQERERFLERSSFFFNDSVDALLKMPTRTLARPVVLLLTNGPAHAYMRQHPDEAAPPPAVAEVDFSGPEQFVPQKARAIRRFKILAAAAALAVLAAGIVFFFK